MARFNYSALFTQTGVAAALDDLIDRDAAQGRVNRQLAMLAAAEYGLPLLKADGNPIDKRAFLKLAQSYRDAKGKGHGIRGHLRMSQWGAAFDAVSLGLMAGADPSPETVQALKDSGQYLGDAAAWVDVTKPTAKPKAVPAPKVGEPAPVPTDKASPAAAEARKPGAVLAVQAEAQAEEQAEAQAEADTATMDLDLDLSLQAVMLALQTGALTRAEVQALADAAADALATMPADSIPVSEASELPAAMV